MPKTLLREYDPLAAIDQIERDAHSDSAPYRRRVEKLMSITLSAEQVGDVDDAGDAAILRQTHAGYTLERPRGWPASRSALNTAGACSRGKMGCNSTSPFDVLALEDHIEIMTARFRTLLLPRFASGEGHPLRVRNRAAAAI